MERLGGSDRQDIDVLVLGSFVSLGTIDMVPLASSSGRSSSLGFKFRAGPSNGTEKTMVQCADHGARHLEPTAQQTNLLLFLFLFFGIDLLCVPYHLLLLPLASKTIHTALPY